MKILAYESTELRWRRQGNRIYVYVKNLAAFCRT